MLVNLPLDHDHGHVGFTSGPAHNDRRWMSIEVNEWCAGTSEHLNLELKCEP